MNCHHNPAADRQLSAALAQMVGALQLLDEADAPGEIGSSLDLAIARLEEHLGAKSRLGDIAERLLSGLPAEPYEEGEQLISCSAWDDSTV